MTSRQQVIHIHTPAHIFSFFFSHSLILFFFHSISFSFSFSLSISLWLDSMKYRYTWLCTAIKLVFCPRAVVESVADRALRYARTISAGEVHMRARGQTYRVPPAKTRPSSSTLASFCYSVAVTLILFLNFNFWESKIPRVM